MSHFTKFLWLFCCCCCCCCCWGFWIVVLLRNKTMASNIFYFLTISIVTKNHKAWITCKNDLRQKLHIKNKLDISLCNSRRACSYLLMTIKWNSLIGTRSTCQTVPWVNLKKFCKRGPSLWIPIHWCCKATGAIMGYIHIASFCNNHK